MTNYYGVIKQMMLSNRDRISKGLELLTQGLYPYVEQQMQQAYPDDWETEAKSKKEAEKQAAENALKKIMIIGNSRE